LVGIYEYEIHIRKNGGNVGNVRIEIDGATWNKNFVYRAHHTHQRNTCYASNDEKYYSQTNNFLIISFTYLLLYRLIFFFRSDGYFRGVFRFFLFPISSLSWRRGCIEVIRIISMRGCRLILHQHPKQQHQLTHKAQSTRYPLSALICWHSAENFSRQCKV